MSSPYLNYSQVFYPTMQFVPHNVSQPMPPMPSEENDIIPGEFKYIEEKREVDMLKNAYSAITITEKWGFMKKNVESYMFSKNPESKVISDKMVELGYCDHTGFSFGWTMRQMEYIAKHGENEYRKFRNLKK